MNIDQACAGHPKAWEELKQLRNALTREKQRQTFYRRRCAVLDEKIEELQQQLYELKLEHNKD